MRKTMMPSMMSGDAFFWVIPGVLLSLVLLVAGVWLLMQWLTHSHSFLPYHGPQPQDEYHAYTQGYQSEQRFRERYQEGEQQDALASQEHAGQLHTQLSQERLF